MWALLLCGTALAALRILCWRSGETWLEFCQPRAMRLFARLWHRCERLGPDPLPATGPAIIVANHPSHADPAFLMASCHRVVHFLHAQEYYHAFLLRRLFARVGCIPVARNGRDVGPVRLALRKLKEGWVLGIFPEGEVCPGPCVQADRVKAGAALLALRSRAPVFPARISGGPQGRSLLRAWLWPSTGVRVTFGPPIDLTPFDRCPPTHQVLEQVIRLFVAAIDALDATSVPPSASVGKRSA